MDRSALPALQRIIAFTVKLIATYVVLLIASIAAGLLFYRNAAPPLGFEPQTYQQAMLIVTLLHAFVICLLASRSRLGFRSTAVTLFTLFFGVQTGLTMAETLFFVSTGSLRFDSSNVPLDLASGAITALAGSVTAAALVRHGKAASDPVFPAGRLALRFAAMVVLYPVVYWVAGLTIALQSGAVLRFYGSSIGNIDPLGLLIFQLFRGAVWAGLALLCVHALNGPRMTRALLAGFAFAILMIAQLLYPNAIMPAPVRAVHAVELFVSNLFFGFVACVVLSRPKLAPHRRCRT